jgi:hypothetical protein
MRRRAADARLLRNLGRKRPPVADSSRSLACGAPQAAAEARRQLG